MSSIQSIQEQLKGLSVEDLLVIIAAATAEAKKAAKVETKVSKAPKEKKGSMPKGVTPPQLHKPRAWVDFVLARSNEKGWEAFAVKGQEEPMPASVERDGAHVFESTGKPMNNKQAMSLSKQYWDRKAATGSNQALYEEFELYYEPPQAAELVVSSEVVVSSEPVVASEAEPKKAEPKKAAPKKTEAEKLAEKEAKALEKAAEKEAEKSKKEADKLAEKERKAAEKKVAPKKVAKAEAETDTFTCADDGQVYPWDWKGKKFLRNSANQIWARTDENEAGEWQGVFDPQTMKIDNSVEEPDFEDE